MANGPTPYRQQDTPTWICKAEVVSLLQEFFGESGGIIFFTCAAGVCCG